MKAHAMNPSGDMSRRALLRGAAAAGGGLGLAGLAACGVLEQGRPRAQWVPGQRVKLTHIHAGSYPPAAQEAVTQFLRANPEFEIEATGVPFAELYTKLELECAAGSGADTAGTGGGIIRFAALGCALALDQYLDKKDLDDFYPVALDVARYKGKLYALPWQGDGRPIVFHKGLIQAAGIDPDKAPDTWEGLLDYARRVTKKVGDEFDVMGLWLEPGPGANHLSQGFVYGAGGGLVEADDTVWFDRPGTIEAVQWVADWGLKFGVAVRGGATYPGGINAAMLAGKLAMFVGGAGIVNVAQQQGVDHVIGVWPMVRGKAKRSAFSFFNNFMVASHTKVREAALKFVKYLTSTDAIITLTAPGRNAVPRKSSAQKAEWMRDARFQRVQEAAGVYGDNEGRSRYSIPIRDTIWVPALNRVWKGEMLAAESCAQAAREARDFVARDQKK